MLCVGRRRYEKEQKRKAPPVPNAEGIPRGTYINSCNGCAMDEEGATLCLCVRSDASCLTWARGCTVRLAGGAGKVLTCTQCKHWSMQSRNWDLSESSIRPSVCTPEEWIGNREGSLACEPKPQTVLEEEAQAAGAVAPDMDAQLDDSAETDPNKNEL